MPIQKKMTLKSIARELGVTHTTVSNAYNNPEKLSPALRERILAYASSHYFHGPDNIGRALRTGKSDAIGVIFNDSLSYVFTDHHDLNLMKGIANACEKKGANIVLIPLKQKDNARINAINAAVDGYILNATFNNDRIIEKALAKGLPIVTTDFAIPHHSSVSIDNASAMQQICLHLLEKGHRRIGIISFPSRQGRRGMSALSAPLGGDNTLMLTRVNACKTTLAAHGIDLAMCRLFETEHDEQHGALAAQALLRDSPAITALICLSDRFALGAVQACLGAGLAIPQDIAITGFDNMPLPDSLPGLTTIAQDAEKKGEMAAGLLLEGKKGVHHNLGFALIVREST
ncbi:LacI family transcriptional regulator [Chimaeribacter californicus]|uniref:LacI family transcriptional regulator n=1 Tax=Chimaeribacter californicus TaxID=2060067 RepID=A0A2N5E1N8_9GAMM|nr:LacI family DNA-binding transcriptional regulator [Chimaeribacter californicus]PLR34376.1 LacI family transcriptional regulator [Chimaeribacter californicus]